MGRSIVSSPIISNALMPFTNAALVAAHFEMVSPVATLMSNILFFSRSLISATALNVSSHNGVLISLISTGILNRARSFLVSEAMSCLSFGVSNTTFSVGKSLIPV
jgi:hypothetical protein